MLVGWTESVSVEVKGSLRFFFFPLFAIHRLHNLRVWKFQSRHVRFSEGILKPYVLSVVLQIKPSDLSLLILVCDQLNFLKWESVLQCSLTPPDLWSLEQLLHRDREPCRTLSFLWHWPWRIYREEVEVAEHK